MRRSVIQRKYIKKKCFCLITNGHSKQTKITLYAECLIKMTFNNLINAFVRCYITMLIIFVYLEFKFLSFACYFPCVWIFFLSKVYKIKIKKKQFWSFQCQLCKFLLGAVTFRSPIIFTLLTPCPQNFRINVTRIFNTFCFIHFVSLTKYYTKNYYDSKPLYILLFFHYNSKNNRIY